MKVTEYFKIYELERFENDCDSFTLDSAYVGHSFSYDCIEDAELAIKEDGKEGNSYVILKHYKLERTNN